MEPTRKRAKKCVVNSNARRYRKLKKSSSIKSDIIIDYTIGSAGIGRVRIDRENVRSPLAIADMLHQHQMEEIDIQNIETVPKETNNDTQTNGEKNNVNASNGEEKNDSTKNSDTNKV